MLVAILICFTTVFTACSNEDNPVVPTDNLAEKIIGSWIHTATDGTYTPTNRKSMHTFVKTGSGLKMYNTIAITDYP
jgi:hypothetical protein